jgi:DNA repair exonuclease SbcCD ATPase subunit
MSDDKNQPEPNFSALTENLNQQQVCVQCIKISPMKVKLDPIIPFQAKISALKELVRQSESQHGRNTASAQEKVKNIAQRLSNLKSKATKSKLHRSTSEVSEDITHYEEEENEVASAAANIPTTSRHTRSETPGSEKITLLRKQMELNRMKMAERENKSKEIEQMVTQLKSRFETSQMSLEKSVELGRSMGDLSSPVPSMLVLHSQNRSVSDVSHTSQPLNFENERTKFLEKRIRELESTLSQKENFSEVEAVQNLERKILDLEETIKEKESVIDARTRAVSLLTENMSKKKKNVVDSLEDTKQEMFKMQETFIETELAYRKDKERLQRLLDEKSAEVTNLNEKNEILEKSRYEFTIENSEIKTKLEKVQDYSTKISELNKLNESLQKRISTLESQRYEFITEDEVGEAKTAEGHATDLSEKIKELEAMLQSRDEEIEKLQDSLQEKTVEVNVVNANMAVLQEKYNSLSQKPLFPADSSADEETQAETAKIKQQLDDSNKSMIKTKLKMKQMQKQIDTLQKSSDGSQEILRLNGEIQTLNLRIAELEEEKGSYQLQLVGNENPSDFEHKLKVD